MSHRKFYFMALFVVLCVFSFLSSKTETKSYNNKEFGLSFRLTKSTRNGMKECFSTFDILKTKEEHQHAKYRHLFKMADLGSFSLRPVTRKTLRGHLQRTLPKRQKADRCSLILVIILEVIIKLISDKSEGYISASTHILIVILIKLLQAVPMLILVDYFYLLPKHTQSKSVFTWTNINGYRQKSVFLVYWLFCMASTLSITIETVLKERIYFVPIVVLHLIFLSCWTVWTFDSFSVAILLDFARNEAKKVYFQMTNAIEIARCKFFLTQSTTILRDDLQFDTTLENCIYQLPQKDQESVIKNNIKLCNKPLLETAMQSTRMNNVALAILPTENLFNTGKRRLRRDKSISEDDIDQLSGLQLSSEQLSSFSKRSAANEKDTCVTVSWINLPFHDHDHNAVRTISFTTNNGRSTSFLDGIQDVRIDQIDKRMSYEALRLCSFPNNFPVSSLKLAQSGFYATGKVNEVQCFSCKMSYDDWRYLDIPHIIHANRSPSCRMVLGTEGRNIPIQLNTNDVLKRLLIQDNNVDLKEAHIIRYKMNRRPRGIAIIINNEVFTYNQKVEAARMLDNRTGTHIDGEKLKTLWEQLHFQVEYHENKTADQMLQIAEKIGRKDHQSFDCLVFCILTHGDYGVLYGSDCGETTLQLITACFHSSICPSLAGKPKLFFIQACQGGLDQTGQAVSMELIDMGKPIATNVMDTGFSETIPNESDFLISYSTVSGYVSFRCPHNGTSYISSLCSNIVNHGLRCDLNSILTKVNYDVGKLEIPNGAAKSKQMPVFKSTLRKSLYFS